MKRKNTISVFIIFMLLLCMSSTSGAREKNWYKSLIDFLQLDRANMTEVIHSLGRNYVRKEIQRLAIENINKHFEKVARLRAQGKTEEEILSQFSSTITAKGTGSISGMVYESDGVTRAQHYVSVWAFNEYGQYSGYDSISSWDNGVYKITDLSPSKYYVKTESHGGYKDEYYKNVTDWRKAKLVRVKKRKETKSINFKLDPYKGEGTISGLVTGEYGTPLSDCQIIAYDEDYNGINSGFTDANGLYEVNELTSGYYKLRVHNEGSENYIDEWYDDAQSYEMATLVKVTEPKTTKNINFILEYGSAIKGKVIYATGKRVGDYECYIIAYDEWKNWIKSTYTDKRGKFELSKLKTGSYRLRFEYSGLENYSDGWYKGANNFEGATPIAIKPHKTKKATIKLKVGGAISGYVFNYNGEPTSGCEVIAYDEYKEVVESSVVVENGNFLILRLPTGNYRLFAQNYGDTSYIVGEEPASEWYEGKYDFEDATFVKVTAPKTTKNIDFTLEKGGYIGGRVFNKQGKPLSYSGSVKAYSQSREMIGDSQICNDGLYFIEGLPTGEYKLQVLYDGEENYKNEWHNKKQNFETADHVKVQAPQMTPGIDFTLGHPGILQGFVTDEDRNRLSEEEYNCQIYVYDAITGEYVNSDNNSFVGGYQFELIGRKYKLAAINLYYNWMLKHNNLAVAFYKNSTKFNNANTIPLKAKSILKLKNLVMEHVNGAISGTIYDETNGQPITEGLYIIFAFDKDGYLVRISGYSHSNAPIMGEYELRGLRPGNYYLLALAATEDFVDVNIHFQWYYRIDVNINFETFTPKINIPITASPVTVNDGETSGIDFYFKFSNPASRNNK